METCKFCGKEIPDGGICGCEESLAAAEDASFSDEETETTDTVSEDFGITDIIEDDETEDIPTENEEVSADETDPLDFLKSAPKYVPEEHEQTAVPVQNTETEQDIENHFPKGVYPEQIEKYLNSVTEVTQTAPEMPCAAALPAFAPLRNASLSW